MKQDKSILNKKSEKSIHKMIVEVDGVCQEWIHNENYFQADRFAKKLKAETDWFERIIKHQPSVGQFYEYILKAQLKEFLPEKYNIGTGFVYDIAEQKHSQQLDIVIYESNNKAPIYKMGDFVIIEPSEVITVCEVKKTLKKTDVKKLIQNNLLANTGSYPNEEYGIQYINLFAFNSNVKADSLVKMMLIEMNNILKDFIQESDSNKQLFIPIPYLTLPNIFLFNEGKIVKSRLLASKVGPFKIEIFIEELGKEGISGDFLLTCTAYDQSTGKGNFIGSNLRMAAINKKEYFTVSIFLVNIFSMAEIRNHFLEEKEKVENFLVSEKKPYRVFLPKKLPLVGFKSFEELTKDRRVIFDSNY